MIVDLIIWTFV